MVDELATNDYVIPHWQAFLPWRSAFLAVPRHALIPDTVWVKNGAGLVPLHRTDDPQRWLDLTYADDSVITQVDDGHPAGPGLIGEAPSSSASCPSIVAVMLAALDAQEGQRVLEIGTGTGYNAALLAHRLEAEQVTTMEIDPRVAAQARRALSDIGFGAVAVITGDGELGYPPATPYDRVICTAACENIPYPWVAQTKPGGLVLTPWKNSYFDGGLVALHVNDAGTAAGTMIGPSSFMWLRQQRTRHPGASPIRTADGWAPPAVGRSRDRTPMVNRARQPACRPMAIHRHTRRPANRLDLAELGGSGHRGCVRRSEMKSWVAPAYGGRSTPSTWRARSWSHLVQPKSDLCGGGEPLQIVRV